MSEERKANRSPTEVIGQLLDVIPSEEAGVRGELERVLRHARYCAPEAEKLLWAEIGQALTDATSTTFTKPWEREAYKIFTTKDPPK